MLTTGEFLCLEEGACEVRSHVYCPTTVVGSIPLNVPTMKLPAMQINNSAGHFIIPGFDLSLSHISPHPVPNLFENHRLSLLLLASPQVAIVLRAGRLMRRSRTRTSSFNTRPPGQNSRHQKFSTKKELIRLSGRIYSWTSAPVKENFMAKGS